jgi:hypothetical protein
VPALERDTSAALSAGVLRERDRAVEILCSDDLAHIVDLVAYADGDAIEVRNSAGRCRIEAGATDEVDGHHPLFNTDPLAFTPLAAEPVQPTNAENGYPFAAERLSSLFADERAPDIVVIHTPAHHWPERGGHIGEHGSLDAVQSRAPLLLSGAGVTARGVLPRAARVRDVGPTLALLAGAEISGAEGVALQDLVTVGPPYVVGLLWDGVNCNDLLELATTGELPAVARLLEHGCALQGGAIAEFPSVTLTNHTSALTGVGPGRHGIVNNTFFDRTTGRQLTPNASDSWHRACDALRPGVETLWEAVRRARPDARTACVDEPIDRGASYSTFGMVRDRRVGNGAAGLTGELPDAITDPHATRAEVERDKDYAWGTSVDAIGLQQVVGLWSDDATRPDVMWWNFTLTDTGHHNGGPHSETARASMRDSDRRLQAFLDLLDAQGRSDDVVFLLTSDHGSELASETCQGDWDDVLRANNIAFRDESYGFIYLG